MSVPSAQRRRKEEQAVRRTHTVASLSNKKPTAKDATILFPATTGRKKIDVMIHKEVVLKKKITQACNLKSPLSLAF